MQRLAKQRAICLKTGMAMNGGNLTPFSYLGNQKQEQIDSCFYYYCKAGTILSYAGA